MKLSWGTVTSRKAPQAPTARTARTARIARTARTARTAVGQFPNRVRVAVRRWSRGRVLAVALLVVLVAAGATWVLLESSVFGLRGVTVVGASRVSIGQVQRTADLTMGTPLARIDTSAVERRLGRLPAVRTAVVSRRWPRGLLITVSERQPAAVRRAGSGFVLVDPTGVVFAEVSSHPPGLPLVSAPAGADPGSLRAALDALADLPPAVRAQVLEVRATTPDEVRLRLTRGRAVLWGSPERGVRKGRVLGVLLTRTAALYDVSAPDVPTTRG